MKPAVALVFGIVSALTLSTTQAQIYQWKDSTGRTVVSDTPPPGSVGKDTRVIGNRQAVVKGETAAEKPAEAPKTMAEKDLEFKKRQQEARDKAEKEAKEQKAEANRKDNCERAKRHLAAMEAKYPVATLDEKGEYKLLNETQRQQEMEQARQFMAESCKQ